MTNSYGVASTYGVQLLCDTTPQIDKAKLLAAIRTRCPGAKFLDGNPNSGLLAFAHEDHPNQLGIAAQTLVAIADKPIQQASFKDAIRQSWSFAEATQTIAGAHASILVTDLMASGLKYADRLSLFHGALAGVLAAVSCRAIHWQSSQCIVNPAAFLEAFEQQPSALFFAGALNVRLFNISSNPGECVMDTLGLAALGLPDIQCHFHGLDKAKMARLLYNLGWYIFESGDVIADGQTIDGLTPGSRWICQHEESIVAPNRIVLDLNPGVGFAAGQRPQDRHVECWAQG